MAKSIVKGYTPSMSQTTVTLQDPQFATKWAVKDESKNEVFLTNLDCPIGFPEIIRLAVSDTRNVYTKLGIDPNLYAPTTRGKSLVVALQDIWKEIDSVDATYEVALPLECHVVLRVPNNETITAADIQAFMERMFSLLYMGSRTSSARVIELLKGALAPAGV